MNKFYNERPYGVGLYVDRLLDEKITFNKQAVDLHINNGDVHVTAEDKERWNSASEAVFSSSDTDEEGNVTIDIPTNISEFNNDVPYVSLSDMSVYATEDEVKTWLAGYLSKAEYDEIKALEESELGEPDPNIIDKFSISDTKASLANAKKVYLDFNTQTGILSVKTAAAQTASLSHSKNGDVDGIEYKQAGSSIITASYTNSDMDSVILKQGDTPLKTMPNKNSDGDVAADKQYTASYTAGLFDGTNNTFTLYYDPTEDNADTATTTIPVLKRYYQWYSTSTSETTIPNSGTTQKLSASKPSTITVNAPSGNYLYLAYPTEWGINVNNVKDKDGYPYSLVTVGTVTGPYAGLTNDYTIIRSTETGLNKNMKP